MSNKSNNVYKSYGLACVNLTNKSICMVKRKNSYAFEIFFKSNNKNNINVELFNNMSLEEKINISTLNYELIAKKYNYNIDINSDEFKKSKIKFERLYMIDNGKSLINLINKSNKSINGIWEIPKGKKEENETDLNAAIREFIQETQIDISNIIILHNKIFKYTFCDYKRYYEYIYYLALTHTDSIHNYKITELSQINEISDIQWLNKDMLNLMINKNISAMCYLSNFALNIINLATKIYKNNNKKQRKILKEIERSYKKMK